MQSFGGHKGTVLACAVVRNYLVTGGYDQTIKLWNLDTGQELFSIVAHDHIVHCLDIYSHPLQFTTIISGSWDKTVKVWRLSDGKLIHTLSHHCNRVRVVKAVSLSPHTPHRNDFSGKESICHSRPLCLSGGDDGKICLWDIEDGVLLRCLSTPCHFIVSLVVILPKSCDYTSSISCNHSSIEMKNPLLLSYGLDGKMRFWDFIEGMELPALLHEVEEISVVAVCSMNLLHLLELKSSEVNSFLVDNERANEILHPASSPFEDNNSNSFEERLVICCGDIYGTLSIYDFKTWLCLGKFLSHPSKVVSLQVVTNLVCDIWNMHEDEIVPDGNDSLCSPLPSSLARTTSVSSMRKLSKSNTEPLSSRKLLSFSENYTASVNSNILNDYTISFLCLLENGNLNCLRVNPFAKDLLRTVQFSSIIINASRIVRQSGQQGASTFVKSPSSVLLRTSSVSLDLLSMSDSCSVMRLDVKEKGKLFSANSPRCAVKSNVDCREYKYCSCVLDEKTEVELGRETTAVSPLEPIRKKIVISGTDGLVIAIPIKILPKKSLFSPTRSVSLPVLPSVSVRDLLRNDSMFSLKTFSRDLGFVEEPTEYDEEAMTSSERNHLYSNYRDLMIPEKQENNAVNKTESFTQENSSSAVTLLEEKLNLWSSVDENQFSFGRVKLHSRARKNNNTNNLQSLRSSGLLTSPFPTVGSTGATSSSSSAVRSPLPRINTCTNLSPKIFSPAYSEPVPTVAVGVLSDDPEICNSDSNSLVPHLRPLRQTRTSRSKLRSLLN
jgi:WD40 repeat protein